MSEVEPFIESGERSAEAKVRIAGRAVMIAAELATTSNFDEEVILEIARLTAGSDPDLIDTTDPNYRAGASAALSSALNAKAEMLPHRLVVERLLTPIQARRFVAFMGGKTTREIEELNPDLKYQEYQTNNALEFFQSSGLIEPKISINKKAVGPTPFGEHVFWKLLPDIAKTVPMEEVLQAVQATLERKLAKDEK